MQREKLITILLVTTLMAGCSTNREVIPSHYSEYYFRIQGGLNKGGIVENTDMDVVPESPVDGLSGATCMGFNVGARVLKPMNYNAIETGIDFMVNSQKFTYFDESNSYFGIREVSTVQFICPLLWNIGLVRSNHSQGLFQLKIGPVLQYNLLHFSHQGDLPYYSYNTFSGGVSLGISSVPFHLNNGQKLGWFLEAYRGSRIYEDFYNQKAFDMPGSSYFKFGFIYQFNILN